MFDCRALPNPGRLTEYQHLTGQDDEVIKFFESKPEVAQFLGATYSLVDQSIENYQQRNVTNLMVNFGCTGGQHRSVYVARLLNDWLEERKWRVRLHHRDIHVGGGRDML